MIHDDTSIIEEAYGDMVKALYAVLVGNLTSGMDHEDARDLAHEVLSQSKD